MTIWKWVLALEDCQFVQMPRGAQLLDAQMQNGALTLWGIVDAGVSSVQRIIWIRGTGHPAEAIYRCPHIATVQDGGLVWHIFDGEEERP